MFEPHKAFKLLYHDQKMTIIKKSQILFSISNESFGMRAFSEDRNLEYWEISLKKNNENIF